MRLFFYGSSKNIRDAALDSFWNLHTWTHYSPHRHTSTLIKPSKGCSLDHGRFETESFPPIRPSGKNIKGVSSPHPAGYLQTAGLVGVPNSAEHADRQPCHRARIGKEGKRQTRGEKADGQEQQEEPTG